MPHLEWREPLWMLLALTPWLILAWDKKRNAQQQRRLNAFADPHLLPRLLVGKTSRSRSAPHWAIILAWTLAALAAAGPYFLQQTPQTEQRRGIDIAVIIDISPSMTSPDIAPSRLQRAKLELRDFVSRLHGDRVALIAFSANAYVTLPLTPDKDTFLHFADLLDPALVMKHGSNLARALQVARQTLDGASPQGRAILLISDGEAHNNQTTLAEAKNLRAAGIPLFILGVGTEAGGPVPDGKGHFMMHPKGHVQQDTLVVSRLARKELMALAVSTGGGYADLSNDDGDIRQLITGLSKIETKSYQQANETRHAYQLFPWLLGVSLLLFMWSGARHRMDILAVLIIGPLIGALPQDAQASPWREQSALEAFTAGDYARAATLYRGIKTYNGPMGLGAVAYRQRDWQQALAAFRQAARLAASNEERAKAAYNSGNALAQLGHLDEAARAYETALAWQKNYPRAALNLSLINKEKQLRTSGGKVGDPQKNTALTPAKQSDRNTKEGSDESTRTLKGAEATGGAGPPGSTPANKPEAVQARQQMQSIQDNAQGCASAASAGCAEAANAQELLSNRFSTADKAAGIIVVEDEKPW
ncbi:MAG: VWA domain-containing protein [Gammaproteobacteria bacterium]